MLSAPYLGGGLPCLALPYLAGPLNLQRHRYHKSDVLYIMPCAQEAGLKLTQQ